MKKSRLIFLIAVAIAAVVALILAFVLTRSDKNTSKSTTNANGDFCNITYKDGVTVIETYNWIFEDDGNGMIVATPDADVPEEGDYILVHDSHRISSARRILSVTDLGGGRYQFETAEVDDPSEVIEEVEFSGSGDFSSYFGEQPLAENTKHSFIKASTVDAAGPSDSSVNLKISFDCEANSDGEISLSTDAQISEPGKDYIPLSGSEYEYDMGDEGADSSGESGDGLEADVSGSYNLSGSLEIKNLMVDATGQFQFTDIKNSYVNVSMDADEELTLVNEGKIEGQIPLCMMKAPIAVTGGVISVYIKPYLEFSVDGKVEVKYEIVGTKFVANASFSKPAPDFSGSTMGTPQTPEIRASVEAEGGIGVAAGVSVLKQSVIEPYISFDANIKGEMLPVVKGWENVPPCFELSAGFPVIKVGCVFLSESDVAELIEKVTGWEPNIETYLVTAENAPLHAEGHIETDEETQKLVLVDACTHVERQEGYDIGVYCYNFPFKWFYDFWNSQEVSYTDEGDYYAANVLLGTITTVSVDAVKNASVGDTITTNFGGTMKKIADRTESTFTSRTDYVGELTYVSNDTYRYEVYDQGNDFGAIESDDDGSPSVSFLNDKAELRIRKDASFIIYEDEYTAEEYISDGKIVRDAQEEISGGFYPVYYLTFDAQGYVTSVKFDTWTPAVGYNSNFLYKK